MFKYRPKYLRSYPDPLYFLCQMAKKENIKLPEVEGINTTGNILFDDVRNLIENRFQSKVFDSYSCEGNPNLFECPTHECYHSSMEYGIIEILDENGLEVDGGGQGRLISTDLQNLASPFIRYDTQDILVKYEKECTCGRKLIPIKKIIGRDNDILVTPENQYLIGQTFTTYFKYLPEIIQFQVIQRKIDEFEFKLVVTENYNKRVELQISEYWKNKIGKNIKIIISTVEEIPLLTSGKRRFLIRNNNIKLDI